MPSGTRWPLRRMRARIVREGMPRVCGWCGHPIDVTLPSSHPFSLELDHVQPRSHGGNDDLGNVRPLHKRCNRQRGAGRRNPQTQGDRSASW
jgi:5-methylcytosine-specific restriction endonuclease McrA